MTLQEYISTQDFKVNLEKVLSEFGYLDEISPISNILVLLAKNVFPINELPKKFVEVIGVNEELATEMSLRIEKECLKQFSKELENNANIFYDNLEKFVSNFDIQKIIGNYLTADMLASQSILKKTYLAVGQYLLLQINENQVLNILTKPEKVGGVGLSDEVGKNLVTELKNISDVIKKNHLEKTLFPEIVNILGLNGFKAEEVFVQTLKDLEEVSQIAKQYKKTVTSDQSRGNGEIKKPESIDSLISQLSKDLGYDNNDNTKSEK